MLKENSKAPDFKLKDKDETEHQLSKIKADYFVVYFYPRDNTPGCTIEAGMFNKNLNEFKILSTQIIGISGGDEKSKTKFCEKHDLKLLLLSDTDFSISKKYRVYGEKSFMGKKYMGINRNTYILDKNLKIIKSYDKVKPFVHANEVLEFVKNQK